MTEKKTKRRWRILPAVILVAIGLFVLVGCFYLGNILPVAIFTVSTTSGTSPLNVAFDASDSYDPDGTITAYDWNFGDAQTGTSGVLVSHIFTVATAPAKVFTVVLTVTDNDGGTDDAVRNITVQP